MRIGTGICLAVICLFTIGFSAHAEEPKTILMFGNSITQGGQSYMSYRQVLVPDLQRKGIAVRFIEPQKDATSAHAGYRGRNTANLLSISKEIYNQYPADIVFIHSGHNRFSKDKPVPGIIRDTEAIIENLQSINPRVTILLAQVIPSGDVPRYAYIPDLNKALSSLADRMVLRGYSVILVNHADGFDWETDTIEDKVHPNASGAKKMADKAMNKHAGKPAVLPRRWQTFGGKRDNEVSSGRRRKI